jgi:hypothetical protein
MKPSSHKKKHFVQGEQVVVQREPAAQWEPALYVKEATDQSDGWCERWHEVELPKGADRLIGFGERAIPTRKLVVPARRIKKEATA